MDFEYFLYDLFTNEKTYKEVSKIIWEPHGFQAIKKLYKETKWLISEKELKDLIENYNKLVEEIHKKYPHLKKFEDKILVRYKLINALSNISLSVPQNIKFKLMKLGITHELFGSPFNTHPQYTYCCLFPDLEGLESSGRCLSDFFDYTPQDNTGYLLNPPYTEMHIRISCEKTLEWLNEYKNLTFVVVLPLWDAESREKYNLSKQKDLPAITKLIHSKFTQIHKIVKNFRFYDGVNDKYVKLKDPVHIIVLNNSEKFNKEIKNTFMKILTYNK